MNEKEKSTQQFRYSIFTDDLYHYLTILMRSVQCDDAVRMCVYALLGTKTCIMIWAQCVYICTQHLHTSTWAGEVHHIKHKCRNGKTNPLYLLRSPPSLSLTPLHAFELSRELSNITQNSLALLLLAFALPPSLSLARSLFCCYFACNKSICRKSKSEALLWQHAYKWNRFSSFEIFMQKHINPPKIANALKIHFFFAKCLPCLPNWNQNLNSM